MAQKLLTQLELKVMNLLWTKQKAFVKELLAEWDGEPVPAYNTISTVVRILEEKQYVGHEAFGRSYKYHPLVSREEYQKKHVKNVLENVFAGSVTDLVSTLVGDEAMDPNELESLKKLIDDFEE